MDVPSNEHSDSDSGESWTMLDHSPTYAVEAPEFPDNHINHEGETEHTDRDDDTDGISIISESEAESPSPCDITGDVTDHVTDNITNDTQQEDVTEPTHCPTENVVKDEPISTEHDFLGDSTGKMRTYVHRRNKRLSTVLNIIVLGSLITAAGVAIGHMWGVRDDCAPQTSPSVNKILSNLYKLQEENAYLRSKLKELTLSNSQFLHQQKTEAERIKRQKKVYDERFNGNEKQQCDFEFCGGDLESHMAQPEFEKEFLTDLDKLKTVYQQNKSWLDEELARRQKDEELSVKKMRNNLQPIKDQRTKPVEIKQETKIEKEDINRKEDATEKKITYADSLKSDKSDRKKRYISEVEAERFVEQPKKKKLRRQLEVVLESASDEEIRKDDRYTKQKEEKKEKRQKHNKKQKRRNKYEQWEMKGGYMKDFDDVSIASSQEGEAAKADKAPLNDFVIIEPKSTKDKHVETERKVGKDNADWHEKRMSQRSEARKKMELEMFGENSRGPAGWYFRRMRRREQCRSRALNATAKKANKRNMNYKTKH